MKPFKANGVLASFRQGLITYYKVRYEISKEAERPALVWVDGFGWAQEEITEDVFSLLKGEMVMPDNKLANNGFFKLNARVKGLNKAENNTLVELRTVEFENRPLINLVEKNYTERMLSDQQIQNVLYELCCDGKISLSSNVLSCNRFDKMIVAHYELLHRGV